MLLRELVDILAHEDVFLRDVREEQLEFCGVERAGERMADDLVEGGALQRVRDGLSCARPATYMPLPPPIKTTSSNSFSGTAG